MRLLAALFGQVPIALRYRTLPASGSGVGERLEHIQKDGREVDAGAAGTTATRAATAGARRSVICGYMSPLAKREKRQRACRHRCGPDGPGVFSGV